jgi:hypothetical protein
LPHLRHGEGGNLDAVSWGGRYLVEGESIVHPRTGSLITGSTGGGDQYLVEGESSGHHDEAAADWFCRRLSFWAGSYDLKTWLRKRVPGWPGPLLPRHYTISALAPIELHYRSLLVSIPDPPPTCPIRYIPISKGLTGSAICTSGWLDIL